MRTECLKTPQDYWNYRDELSIQDGLVLKGIRIIIPDQCREELLKQLHEGHFGTDQTKLRARDLIYWPGINKDIELLVKTCNTCQENAKRNSKDPVFSKGNSYWSHGQHLRWTYLHWMSHTFLLVVDVTSRFPVVRILNTESFRSVLSTHERYLL